MAALGLVPREIAQGDRPARDEPIKETGRGPPLLLLCLERRTTPLPARLEGVGITGRLFTSFHLSSSS